MRVTRKLLISTFFAAVLFQSLLSPNVAFGQTSVNPPTPPPMTPVQLTNPIGFTSVEGLVGNIVRTILGVVGALAFLMFVYGGVLWLTSAGNTQRVEKGRETLKWATIGLVLIFSSYAIINIILDALVK